MKDYKMSKRCHWLLDLQEWFKIVKLMLIVNIFLIRQKIIKRLFLVNYLKIFLTFFRNK
jgi:hypothetical protein